MLRQNISMLSGKVLSSAARARASSIVNNGFPSLAAITGATSRSGAVAIARARLASRSSGPIGISPSRRSRARPRTSRVAGPLSDNSPARAVAASTTPA